MLGVGLLGHGLGDDAAGLVGQGYHRVDRQREVFDRSGHHPIIRPRVTTPARRARAGASGAGGGRGGAGRTRVPPMAPGQPPDDAREWVSFEDPGEERTWVFDVTFLTSNWTCIYGHGCQGVLTEPTPELVHGCCSYGAHLIDGKDARRVEKAAATLTAEQWQFRDRGKKDGVIKKNKHGEMVTRVVKGACIFLNRPGFADRPGMRPAPGGGRAGPGPARAQARGLLAAPAAARGRGGRRRPRDLHHPPVGPAPLGEGRRGVRLVVHRGPRRLRGDAGRSTWRWRRS